MRNFEDFWKEFNPIMVDMNENGMCFFEGYLPNVPVNKLDVAVRSICDEPFDANIDISLWSNEVTEEMWSKNYSTDECLHSFQIGNALQISVSYQPIQENFKLELTLMIEKWQEQVDVEIICERDPIFSSESPKLAVKAAIIEFLRLKELFGGDFLYVGPDTTNYPDGHGIHPEEWIRVFPETK